MKSYVADKARDAFIQCNVVADLGKHDTPLPVGVIMLNLVVLR